ncbi:formylglycine-generating enzyme family protein [Fulvivirga lutimaris]|uniref:formylglycine-generating enzyme family protein n=1 Tax=Fulvivirga lutimaris TaxID=1819566 RepID=UPI0012BCB242|nr:formylglycine-generating enzyme family protein [Fulvivirga lutimaris]MTI39850.1 formylglycine-generating enzyme family protein [Fulvivirga lutimaris]
MRVSNRFYIVILVCFISNYCFGQKLITKEVELAEDVKITMIYVPIGNFTMGSPESELERNAEREKQHKVTITKGFWLAETEFTQAQWEKIMGNNPSLNKAWNHPVDQVSYNDVQSLLTKINKEGKSFRLPTEAEWEYACRAGSDKAYVQPIDDMVWHIGNSGGQLHPVATKKPNGWGLYDMQGNILEWCSDWFIEDNTNESTNPKGPKSGTHKVQRGGQFTGRTKHTRAADRQRGLPDDSDFYVGFRLAADEI